MRDWNLRVILQRIWGEQRLDYRSWAIQRDPDRARAGVLAEAERRHLRRRSRRVRRQLEDAVARLPPAPTGDGRGARRSAAATEVQAAAAADGARAAATPYKGLVPFAEADAPFFFGRDAERKIIAANLRASRLTLLYGASGVGKSSVLRAGVIPRPAPRLDARTSTTCGEPRFAVVAFSAWRDDPLAGLARAIEAALDELVEDAGAVAGRDRSSDAVRGAGRSTSAASSWSSSTSSRSTSCTTRRGGRGHASPRASRRGEPGRPARQLPRLRSARTRSRSSTASRAGSRTCSTTTCGSSTSTRSRARGDRRAGRALQRAGGRASADVVDRARARRGRPRPSSRPGAFTSARPAAARPATPARRGAIETPYLQLVMTRLWDGGARGGLAASSARDARRPRRRRAIVRDSSRRGDERALADRTDTWRPTSSATSSRRPARRSPTRRPTWRPTPRAPRTSPPVLERLAGSDVRILRPVPGLR